MPADTLARSHCRSAHIAEGDYRPDIDGLRAIAVLAVIGFHAFPSLVPGGFVGVDIFFVISGYLISKHILAELDVGMFSTGRFYARRVKRIFPALILTLAGSAGLGWIILTPGEYEALGKHIAGGAGFVANIVYWTEAGYFDSAADTKPLLHLWSLGIEEQFYIVWPLLLALLWRHPRLLGWAIMGLLGASLAYSVVLVQHDAIADFYSPLTRFWEFALGAAVAYSVLHKARLSAPQRQALAWLGLGLITLAIATLKKSTDPFPGALALPPAVGAACLIYAGNDTWFNRQVLGSRILVWIGLISYPLYLWHWPLLSFARIIESETAPPDVRLWLIAASFVLAALTYRLVERPIRARSGKEARPIVFLLSLTMLMLFAGGIIIRKFDGFKMRHLNMLNGDVATLTIGADRSAQQEACGVAEAQKHLFQFCLSDKREAPRLAVLGDSKAEALYYGLARESAPGMRWLLIGSVWAPKEDAQADDRQQLKNRLAFQSVTDNPSIKLVALVVAMRDIFPVNGETGFIEGNADASAIDIYSRAIRQLEQAGKRVVFVLDNPTFPDPRSCINGGLTSNPLLNKFLWRKSKSRCTISYTDHLAGTDAYRRFVAELGQRNPGLTVYDPTPLLCDIRGDRCTITRDGKFLYSYADHISDYANSLIAHDLLPAVYRLVR